MAKRRDTRMICTQCGNVGPVILVTKGSFGVELVMWLLLIIPGVIYSVWRLTSRHRACGECKSADIIPVVSPRGQKLMAEYGR